MTAATKPRTPDQNLLRLDGFLEAACGCSYRGGCATMPRSNFVHLCPLHATAPALLAALNLSARAFHQVAVRGSDRRYHSVEFQSCTHEICKSNRAAIAAAEGK